MKNHIKLFEACSQFAVATLIRVQGYLRNRPKFKFEMQGCSELQKGYFQSVFSAL